MLMIGNCCSFQSAGATEPYIVVCVSYSRVFSWHFYFSATLNVLSPKVSGPSVNGGESEKILSCKTSWLHGVVGVTRLPLESLSYRVLNMGTR